MLSANAVPKCKGLMHTAKLPEITLHGATFSSVCWVLLVFAVFFCTCIYASRWQDSQDMGYCLKWCGRPQWCLSPIYAAGSFNTEELVEDPLFYLFVKPPMSSFEILVNERVFGLLRW